MNTRRSSYALHLLLCVLICLFSVTAMAADSTEQIPHGDAENISTIADAGFYTNSSDAAVVVDPTDETGTNHVFKFTSASYNWFETKAALCPLVFEKDKSYKFHMTFWMDPDAAVTESTITVYLYSAKNDYHPTNYFNLKNFYYKASDGKYDFTVSINSDVLDPADTSYEFGFRVDTAGAVIYADDFSIIQVDEAIPEHIALVSNSKVFNVGDPIQVQVTSPGTGSWLAIMDAGIFPNSSNYDKYSWSYTDKANASGIVTLTAPSTPGKYTLYYFPDGGYGPLESLSFEVEERQKLVLDKTTYRPGETMNISYLDAASTMAWVGVYPDGILPGTSMNSLVWAYVPAAGDGTMTLKAPKDQGSYTAYLLYDAGYTVVTSVSFTVESSTVAPVAPASVAFERAESAGDGYSDGAMTALASETVTDGVLFYWGDADGILDAYTYIGYGEYDQSSGKYTYTPTAGGLIPAEATRLYARGVTGSSYDVENGTAILSDEAAFCEIENTLPSLGKRLYSFEVISDMHVTDDYNSSNGKNVLSAFKDILDNRSDSSAIFAVGDNVDHGKPEEYAILSQYLEETGLDKKLPIYYTVGNHEFYYEQEEGAATGEFFDKNWQRFREFAGWNENEFYRYTVINGDYFILMGEEARGTADAADSKQGTADGYFSEAQREWLRGLLNKAASENANAFVFMHQSIDNTVSGSFDNQNWSGINDDDKMQAIIESYQNTYLFTGHSHWDLHSKTPFVNGGTNGASYFNTASAGYIWSDANQAVPGSEGLTVDVYENYIVVRGRDFVNQKWVPAVYACIPKNTEFAAQTVPNTLPQTSIRTTDVKGIRFKATLDKSLLANENCQEVGFMVTRDKYFTDTALCGDESKFILANEKLNTSKTLASGIAYNPEKGINKLREDSQSENMVFTATVRGIKESAENYKELLHVRAYVKISGITYYGNVQAKSLYDAALAYKKAYPEETDTFADEIIKVATSANNEGE